MNEGARQWGTIPGYELTEWHQAYGVVAGVTDRARDFRLPEHGLPKEFAELLTELGPGFEQMLVSRQVHGASVARQRRRGAQIRRVERLDGHVTSDAGLVLAVTVADCVPIYLVHPGSGAVGLLHAGWRGIAAGIVEQGARALAHAVSGSVPDIVMHCGVSICGDCYEVGPEVFDALGLAPPAAAAPVDLRDQIVVRAQRMGVSDVTRSDWCTAHHHERFHSHRASNGADGRQVAFIGHPAP